MKKNNKLSEYLVKHWHFYVIWLVLVLFVWELLFATITAPKKEKTVRIFIAAFEVDDTALKERLSTDKSDYLKNVDIYALSPALPQFYTLFETHGLLDSDVLILPENVYTEGDYFTQFARIIDKEYFAGFYSGAVYLEKDGKAYGIKVFDGITKTGIAEDYVSYTYENFKNEDYFLFFNKRSLHTGKLSESELDGAIKLAADYLRLINES